MANYQSVFYVSIKNTCKIKCAKKSIEMSCQMTAVPAVFHASVAALDFLHIL